MKKQKIYILISVIIFSALIFWSYIEFLDMKKFIQSFKYIGQEADKTYYSIETTNKFLANIDDHIKNFTPEKVLQLSKNIGDSKDIEIGDSLITIKIDGPLCLEFDRNGNFKKVYLSNVFSLDDYDDIKNDKYPYKLSLLLNPSSAFDKINHTSPFSFFGIIIVFFTVLNILNYFHFKFHKKILNKLYFSILISIFSLIFSSFLFISFHYLYCISVENINSSFPNVITIFDLIRSARYSFSFASIIIDIQIINFILLIYYIPRFYFLSQSKV